MWAWIVSPGPGEGGIHPKYRGIGNWGCRSSLGLMFAFLAHLFFIEKHKSYCYHSVVVGIVGVVGVVVYVPSQVKICVIVTL